MHPKMRGVLAVWKLGVLLVTLCSLPAIDAAGETE
jgi:hypothetical protein